MGAYLADDGRVWTIKAGDCQAWGRFQGGWQGLTVGDDHDSTGALTRWLGMPPERLGAPPVTVREGCESVILGSDGLSRTLDEPSGDEAIPFDEARALCARAVQAGEPDNITAVVMRRSAPAPAARRGLLAALLLLAFSVGLFAAQMLSGPSTQVVLEPVDVVVPIPAQPTPTTAEVRL